MDPATGASTWALGSHRWVRYIGVFTIKAIIEINHHKDDVSVTEWDIIKGRISVMCPDKKFV